MSASVYGAGVPCSTFIAATSSSAATAISRSAFVTAGGTVADEVGRDERDPEVRVPLLELRGRLSHLLMVARRQALRGVPSVSVCALAHDVTHLSRSVVPLTFVTSFAAKFQTSASKSAVSP